MEFQHTYRSKTIHKILKSLSEDIVLDSMDKYIKEVAFKACYRAGIPNFHLVPSFSDKLRAKVYNIIEKHMPEEYMQQALKDVTERESRIMTFD